MSSKTTAIHEWLGYGDLRWACIARGGTSNLDGDDVLSHMGWDIATDAFFMKIKTVDIYEWLVYGRLTIVDDSGVSSLSGDSVLSYSRWVIATII